MDDGVNLNIEMFDEMVAYDKSDPQGARVELLTRVPDLPDNVFTVSLNDFQNGHVRLEHVDSEGFEGFCVNCSGSTLQLKSSSRKYFCEWLQRNNLPLGPQLVGK